MRRMFIALGISLLIPVILAVSAALGVTGFGLAAWSAALILALALGFYALFRIGLNLRFDDPSLTREMLVAAVLCVALFSYWAGQARPALELFYPMAVVFGALRFSARRLLGITIVALLAHALMLTVWQINHPGVDGMGSLLDFVALAIVLPCFAAVCAFVNSLRTRLSDSNSKLTEALARIERIAVRDELTGLYNRRFLMDFLAREVDRVRRSGGGYAVCMIDIDHFKDINDKFGHGAGDAVLRHFASVVERAMRSIDVLGRLGGEEFLVVLPDASIAGARNCAERIRQAVEGSVFPGLPSDYHVTVTAGVVWSGPREMTTDLLARADAALYSGKAAGRNRVVAVG